MNFNSTFLLNIKPGLCTQHWPLSNMYLDLLNIKKLKLDQADPKNYWPISKLTFLAKLLEKMVYEQLTST